MVSIKEIGKARALKALFNHSHQQGMGFLDPTGTSSMTLEDAQKIIDSGYLRFDYLRGRVLKVDLRGDDFDPWLYDRDNGAGAAEFAILDEATTPETRKRAEKMVDELIDEGVITTDVRYGKMD